MTALRRIAGSSAVVVVALVLAACGSSGGGTSSGGASDLTVSAASSLTGAFTELGDAFEAAHPGVRVAFNFGGSSSLAEQIVQGAPVDVFASASSTTMQTVLDAALATRAVDFASNTLQIATPPDNPRRITGIADLHIPLSKVPLTLVTCDVAVPCGAATTTLFEKQGWNPVDIYVSSREPDVKSVLAKVAAGEADAGIVYVTDVLAAGADVQGVVIPADRNVTTTYPIAVLSATTNPAAQQFADFVLSPTGREVLTSYGFGKA